MNERPVRGPHGRARRGGPGGGEGRHRARRGALVEAVLALLDERPMHGYELITELEDRSEGRWRPSAGAMYPALTRMEERDLVVAEQVDGKKRYSLTDDGRARLADIREASDDESGEPWSEHHTGGRGDLRHRVHDAVGLARRIGRSGTREQIDAAVEVFNAARKALRDILADAEIDAAGAADTTEPDATS